MQWSEHPIAIAPDQDFDGSIIDTGAVFQHPNGTVLAIYATSNITSNLPDGTFDGDICLAVSRDPELLVWTKLCHQPNGRIVNPTCHWCRETCPASCKENENASQPSPFPGIAARMAHRDPVAPWLDSCGDGSANKCWYALSGSGGALPGHEELGVKSAMVMWKTDYHISTSWSFVKIFWNSPGRIYSCPDFFRLPVSSSYVFGSLDGNYWIGSYTHDKHGTPHFDGPLDSSGITASAANGSLSGMGIWKTGGVGSNNVMSPNSRRVLFGTIGWTNGNPLPSLNPLTSSLHVGSVAALPRDVTEAIDGGLGLAFVPELASLRENDTHIHVSEVSANSSSFSKALYSGSQHIEVKAMFAPINESSGYGLAVLAPPSLPSGPSAKKNCSDPFVPCFGWDRGGHDSLDIMGYHGTVQQCEALCLANASCMAWTWCGVGAAGPGPRCCLKSSVPDKVAPFANMACGIAPRAKGHIPAGAMDFSNPKATQVGGVAITFDPSRQLLSVATHMNPGHTSTPLHLRSGEALSLHIFVGTLHIRTCRMLSLSSNVSCWASCADGGLIEVVANGRASLAASVPQPRANDTAVHVIGTVGVNSFEAWALKSIWT
eukprot:SAG31_NODE_3491_length_4203_cov_2.510478_3_plen_603_part_00